MNLPLRLVPGWAVNETLRMENDFFRKIFQSWNFISNSPINKQEPRGWRETRDTKSKTNEDEKGFNKVLLNRIERKRQKNEQNQNNLVPCTTAYISVNLFCIFPNTLHFSASMRVLRPTGWKSKIYQKINPFTSQDLIVFHLMLEEVTILVAKNRFLLQTILLPSERMNYSELFLHTLHFQLKMGVRNEKGIVIETTVFSLKISVTQNIFVVVTEKV